MLNHTETDEKMMEYLPLVEKAARNVKVKSHEYEMEDLINIGFIGLMDALEKFDESKKVPFENYAYIRIKGSIIDEIRKNAKVPRSQIQKLNEYYKAKEELEHEFHRVPSEQEICKRLGINDKQLSALHNTVLALSNISLNEVLFEENPEGATRLDYIEDETLVSSDDLLLQDEQEYYLHQAIKRLTEREQTILQLYYKEELQLKDIAYIFDISVPRVSQIHGKTLMKLREYIQEAMEEEQS